LQRVGCRAEIITGAQAHRFFPQTLRHGHAFLPGRASVLESLVNFFKTAISVVRHGLFSDHPHPAKMTEDTPFANAVHAAAMKGHIRRRNFGSVK